MKPLTDHQRETLIRRLERELVWSEAAAHVTRAAHSTAEALVAGLEWSGVHGASEKRAIELIVSRIEEEAAS